eukprot:scaffold149_cov383-Prasinococcus_capsulatus_cf.AAC.18
MATGSGSTAKVLKSNVAAVEGFRWVTLTKLEYQDENGDTRLWEMAERTTRAGPSHQDGARYPVSTTRQQHCTQLPASHPGSRFELASAKVASRVCPQMIELPAGLIDQGESPEVRHAVIRLRAPQCCAPVALMGCTRKHLGGGCSGAEGGDRIRGRSSVYDSHNVQDDQRQHGCSNGGGGHELVSSGGRTATSKSLTLFAEQSVLGPAERRTRIQFSAWIPVRLSKCMSSKPKPCRARWR